MVLMQIFESRQTEPIFNFSLRGKHCFPYLQDHGPRLFCALRGKALSKHSCHQGQSRPVKTGWIGCIRRFNLRLQSEPDKIRALSGHEQFGVFVGLFLGLALIPR
jgi:hypothetical protein